MPRTARVAPGGFVFHVLNRGNARADLFESDGDYAAFLAALAETLEAVPGVRLLAYCLMPNHWHLVLWPRADGELGRFMQRLTITHVRRRHQNRGTTGGGHVYQGTYKSFPVQRDEHFLAVCRYVERNPLRAKLVRRAEDWPWSSLAPRRPSEPRASQESREPRRVGPRPARAGRSRREVMEEPAPPPLHDWPVDRPPDWVRVVNAPQTAAEEQALRDSVRRGRPFGAGTWQRATARRLGLESTFRPRGRPPKRKTAAT
jgi:putative transposase